MVRPLPARARNLVGTRTCLALALLFLSGPPGIRDVHAQGLTIQQVYGYTFPTGLVFSPSGERIAWSGDEAGRRNVWVAEAPDWAPRRLTRYFADDGQEVRGIQFTPDGAHVLYQRGGDRNRDGELPNPMSDIQGVSTDLWMASFEGGDPERVAAAVRPVVSPVRNQAVWSDGQAVWLLDLQARHTMRLFTVRSDVGELQWSPEGTRLAFSSNRDGRSILGIYDLPTGTLRWITNDADRDRMPRWSPDGTRLGFIRDPAGYRGFVVCTVDAATGEVIELWRTPDDGTGGYPRGIDGSYDLMYGAGWLVFPGEWSGWNHLYAIPEDGGDVEELTPGDGIVENAALSADGKAVWVSTSIAGIDHRQLGAVDLETREITWVEQGKAIAWNPAPGPDGTWLAYIRSDWKEPASVYIRELSGRDSRRVSTLPEDFPTDALVEPQQVVFTAPDGLSIHGQLFLPKGQRRGQRAPAVIFMHGGSRRQMLLGFHNRGYYHGAYAFNQYLASQGYVVLSVNYRSGIGYGVDFREPADYGYRGASEYQDIVAAGHFLQARPEVDPDAIGLWGGSYGGYLTAMGLARDSDLFKAGVDLHGVHDWSDQLRWYGNGEIRAPTEEARAAIADLAFRSSPVADIATWRSPVLIIQGDDDRNVPFEASIDLVARLRRKGDVPFQTLFFPDEVHGFLRHASWVTVFERASEFFDRYLKQENGGGPLP